MRVRHHTSDEGLDAIRRHGAVLPSRGWGEVPAGVHVEVEPFGPATPSLPGRPGVRYDVGSAGDGGYVEFDAPGTVVRYVCGPRNTAIIPADRSLSLSGLSPAFVKVRRRWWEFWRHPPGV